MNRQVERPDAVALLVEKAVELRDGMISESDTANLAATMDSTDAVKPGWIQWKDAAEALSLSNLAFLPVWNQLIGNSLDERASYGLASTESFLTAVIDIFVLAAIFHVSTTVLRRSQRFFAGKAAHGVFWLFFIFSMSSVAESVGALRETWLSTLGGLSGFNIVVVGCCAAVVFISAHARRRFTAIGAIAATPVALVGNTAPATIVLTLAAFGLLLVVSWGRNARRTASIITLALFPFVPMTLFQAGLSIAECREKQCAPLVQGSRRAPRVIWLVFDGLDYKITFDQRPAGLDLRELDRLRNESIFATNAYPPADYTMMSMPALISGRLVSATKPETPSKLMVTYADSDVPVSWDSQPSVFTQARDLGVNSAIVGWYHPYCRILADQVVRCMSCNTAEHNLAVAGGAQFLTALRANPLVPKLSMLDTADSDARRWREQLIQSYREIMRASLEAVSNPEIGLVLLHLPAPHPPSVFNRASNDFDASGTTSYLDELKLVDNTVGELRRALESRGLWEDAVVVLSSDHWWRGDLWRHMRDSRARSWTAEDEAIFTGVDERVPFILKVAGSRSGRTYTPEFNTVLTRDLCLAALTGNVADAASAIEWLDTHRSIGKSPYKYTRRD